MQPNARPNMTQSQEALRKDQGQSLTVLLALLAAAAELLAGAAELLAVAMLGPALLEAAAILVLAAILVPALQEAAEGLVPGLVGQQPNPVPLNLLLQRRTSIKISQVNCIYHYLFNYLTFLKILLPLFISTVVKGITQISPPRRIDSSEKVKANKRTKYDCKTLLEFEFHSYLQMEGVEKNMLENSK